MAVGPKSNSAGRARSGAASTEHEPAVPQRAPAAHEGGTVRGGSPVRLVHHGGEGGGEGEDEGEWANEPELES